MECFCASVGRSSICSELFRAWSGEVTTATYRVLLSPKMRKLSLSELSSRVIINVSWQPTSIPCEKKVATNEALLDCHKSSENKRLSGNVTQNFWLFLEFISLESHSVNCKLFCSSCISCVTWFTMELLSVSSSPTCFHHPARLRRKKLAHAI